MLQPNDASLLRHFNTCFVTISFAAVLFPRTDFKPPEDQNRIVFFTDHTAPFQDGVRTRFAGLTGLTKTLG